MTAQSAVAVIKGSDGGRDRLARRSKARSHVHLPLCPEAPLVGGLESGVAADPGGQEAQLRRLQERGAAGRGNSWVALVVGYLDSRWTDARIVRRGPA